MRNTFAKLFSPVSRKEDIAKLINTKNWSGIEEFLKKMNPLCQDALLRNNVEITYLQCKRSGNIEDCKKLEGIMQHFKHPVPKGHLMPRPQDK